MTKNGICAQTLLHTVKQRNKMGVVEKFYMVDVLTVYRTYMPYYLSQHAYTYLKLGIIN